MENITNEVWRDIPGYYGVYQVSDMGRVRRWLRTYKRWKILRGNTERNGEVRYMLTDRLGRKRMSAARHIVAQTFITGRGLDVIHINGDRGDSRVCNLKYATEEEIAWSAAKKCARIIERVDEDGTVTRYPNRRIAAEANYMCETTLGQRLLGRVSAKTIARDGCVYRYAEI